MNFLSFLRHRSKYYWLLLLTLVFGIVLATTILASGPILIDALLEYGLRRTLLNASLKADVFYVSARESADPAPYQATDDQLNKFLAGRPDKLVQNLIPAGHIGFMYPWEDGKISLEHRLTLGFYGTDVDEFSRHASFVDGDFPTNFGLNTDELPVFIGRFLADALGIQVGDIVPASVSARAAKPEISLRVKGIITPQDYQDSYWLDHFNPIWPLENSGDVPVYGVFVPRESFFGLAERFYPNLDVSYYWQANMQLDQVTFENIDDMQQMFGALGNDLAAIHPNLRANTILVELLNEYTSEVNIVRAPLYFLVGVVVLVALYYLVMMSSLYFEQLRSEFAVLRSRGATSLTLFKMEFIEGIFFGGIAILSGPIIAWLFVRWLASSGPLAVLTESGWGLSIPQAAWLSACVAALASLVSLLLPLPSALKRSVIAYQQNLGRSGRPPWWQRFYLDVFALAIGIILLYRVQLYGSIIGGSTVDPQVDLMLIIAPLCLLLGSAAIFLRIFPVILRRSAGLASRGRGLPVLLALQHAARDPRHVTRLVLLLMLAMALGLFSTSLDATLTKNEADRSDYFVGSDLRVITAPANIKTANLPGLESESWIWRSEAALITGGVSPGLNLLAVDPDTFSTVTQYRSDFASQPVEELLDQLSADWEENWVPLQATDLPGEPTQLGLWFSLPFSMQVEPDRFDWIESITFEARLRPAQGDDIKITLHPTAPPDDPQVRWYYFKGDIPVVQPEQYPLSLISLWFHSSSLKLGDFEAIWLDDISVIDGLTGNEIVVESFESPSQPFWQSTTYPMRIFSMGSHPHSGDLSLSMNFDTAGISPLRWYGFNRIDDLALQPIPALASPDFLARNELVPGEFIRIKVRVPGNYEWDSLTFKILDKVNYFPTMYETQEAGFLVTLREPLFEQINLYRYQPLQSNELIISSTDTEADHTALLDSGLPLNQVYSADAILLEIRTNPLAIGLRSSALFGYILTTVLCLVGFGTHFYITTRQRVSGYSILRALGLSPRQLYTTLFIEQTILMLSGLAFGTILGILLNQLTLSGLPLRLGVLDTIPPFLVQTNWILVIRVYITLVIALLLSMSVALLFLWRVRIHRVLRIGEE